MEFTQVKRGVYKFLESEFLGKMSPSAKFLGAVGLELMMNNLDIRTLNEMPLIKLTGVVKGNDIEVDSIYEIAKKHMNGQPIHMDTQLLGKVTFTPQDLEKLYSCIRQG